MGSWCRLAVGGRAAHHGRVYGALGVVPHRVDRVADMAEAGTLDLSVFEHVCHPLDKVNEAISGIAQRNGGFSNFVINP